MGFGIGEGENLRITRLSETNTRSVHTRGTERETSTARGGSSAFLRATSATSRHCRDTDGSGDGCGNRA